MMTWVEKTGAQSFNLSQATIPQSTSPATPQFAPPFTEENYLKEFAAEPVNHDPGREDWRLVLQYVTGYDPSRDVHFYTLSIVPNLSRSASLACKTTLACFHG